MNREFLINCHDPCFPQQAANDSSVEEELGLMGDSAEDTEAEVISKICETELLAGKKTFFKLSLSQFFLL